jgi:hypothetical protein
METLLQIEDSLLLTHFLAIVYISFVFMVIVSKTAYSLLLTE